MAKLMIPRIRAVLPRGQRAAVMLVELTVVVVISLGGQRGMAADPTTIQRGMTLRLNLFVSNLGGDAQGSPADIVAIPDDPQGRMAIATFRGLVRLIDESGTFMDSQAKPFLDSDTGWAQDQYGLTGIAFHPEYLQAGTGGYGKVYAIVSDDSSGSVDFPGLGPDGPGAHDEILREFTASDPTSNNPAFTNRDVIRFHLRTGWHNIMDLTFDSTGLLYVAAGDGQNGGASQSKGNFLGTMFRINPLDPSGKTDAELATERLTRSFNGKYANPTSNPTLGIPAEFNEVFACGLRSPYRFNVDRGDRDGTGRDDVYVGDVGENAREEVNRLIENGNFGWNVCEGTLGTPPPSGSVDPVFELAHSTALNKFRLISGGYTVIGGFVYRGSAIRNLQGKYVLGKWAAKFRWLNKVTSRGFSTAICKRGTSFSSSWTSSAQISQAAGF